MVNTHANGDHTHGNGCCEKAEIIASAASLAEMEALSAAGMAAFVAAAPRLGAAGAYVADIFGGFDFAGVIEAAAHAHLLRELELKVGDKPAG